MTVVLRPGLVTDQLSRAGSLAAGRSAAESLDASSDYWIPREAYLVGAPN